MILCDLRSGCATHRLQGHDGPAQVTQWSPRNQHILVSGGRDHTVRMWDVRGGRSTLMILDPENTSPVKSRVRKRMKIVPQAHKSRVTSLCFTGDGLWLLSFSYDGDLKLWNSTTGENMHVNYGETYTEIKRNLRMAVTFCTYPDLVFVPSKSEIVVYEILTGKLVNVLRGHFLTVMGVIYNPSSLNLYSFGTDRNFITWTPKKLLKCDLADGEEEEDEGTNQAHTTLASDQQVRSQATQDTWSSDED